MSVKYRLSGIVLCIIGSLLAAPLIACGSDAGTSSAPAAPEDAGPAPLLVMDASLQTTADTGIVRWEFYKRDGYQEVQGKDGNDNIVATITLRVVDNHDGNGSVIELRSGSDLFRVRMDGHVLVAPPHSPLLQDLQQDLAAYMKAHPGGQYDCFTASATALGACLVATACLEACVPVDILCAAATADAAAQCFQQAVGSGS